MANMRNEFHGQTYTFFLSKGSQNQSHVLQEIPFGLFDNLTGQRRSSQKSRAGCENCKRRRVKCDELVPCSRCARSGQLCRSKRGLQYEIRSVAANLPVGPTLPGIEPINAGVNLLHLELFHHFFTHTVSTLTLIPDVWHSCISLSFHFDFLANIMLSLAARHIAFLRSENSYHNNAAARHLGLCLASFHKALQGDLNAVQIDAFIATSLLLLHEVWTEFEVCCTTPGGVQLYDPTKDSIFTFATSLKGMFLHVLPRWPGNLEETSI
ncbi:hypothetical protein ACQKWADRAFT_307420 [Trichoderma austrokoningii]